MCERTKLKSVFWGGILFFNCMFNISSVLKSSKICKMLNGRVVLASNHKECLGLTKMIARGKTKSMGGYTPKCSKVIASRK